MADSKISQLASGTPTTSDTGVMVQGGVNKNFTFGNLPISTATQTALDAKQTTLVSGTNIKTINGNSILGSGNLVISGAGLVDSVNGQIGEVVLDADDISDATTTNKFTTAGDILKLAGIEAGAEVNNISDVNATDLTDGGDTTLHNHNSTYYTKGEVNSLVSNVGVNFFTLSETIVLNGNTYQQSCISQSDARYSTTPTEITGPTVTGTGIAGGKAVSDAGVITSIPAGPITTHLKVRKISGNADFTFYYEYYKLNTTTGTETLLGTSSVSDQVHSNVTSEFSVSTILPATILASDERLMRKGFFNKVGGGTDPVVGISVEGTDPTYVSLALPITSVSQSHNDTTGKQGGTTGEYYHLTSAELDKLKNSVVVGPMTAADWYVPAFDGATGELIKQSGIYTDALGRMGLNSTSLTSVGFRHNLPMTGGATAYGMYLTPQIQPDVTTAAYVMRTNPTTASNGGTPYTINSLIHLLMGNGVINSDSIITNNYGGYVSSSFTQGTNNYGYYCGIPSGANNYGLYFGGTAKNFLNGALGLGTTTPTAALHIKAGISSSGGAPLKFTTGTALTTPEDGAMEYHNSHLYFTIGSTRYQIDQQSGGSGKTKLFDLAFSGEFTGGSLVPKTPAPGAGTFNSLTISSDTLPTGSNITIDVRKNGTSILSAPLSITTTESATNGIYTATTGDAGKATITTTTFSAKDRLEVIGVAGSTLPGTNVTIQLIATLT